MREELKTMISDKEKIVWEGKPNKKCFIFESIFNPLLPFALLWGIVDFSIIGFSVFSNQEQNILWFIIPFFALHLMPVWIYLGGVILSVRKYRNAYFIVTDRAIYVSGGIFVKSFNTKLFAEMSNINIHRGIFDQLFNVGDVICTTNQRDNNGGVVALNITSISNYTEVFNIVKDLQQDIYTDVMYPNDMRPKENHGYNTEYKK